MIDKQLIHQAAEDIDIFTADLTEEYERLKDLPRTPKRHTAYWIGIVATVAACFLCAFLIYGLYDTEEQQQLAIVDKPTQKVPSVKEDNATEETSVGKDIVVIPEEKKNVKKFSRKKDIEAKDEGGNVCVLPEIDLYAPASKAENEILAQYANTRKEYDFDVVCYNVLPEISNNDNKTFTSAGTEIKQICDNIYYNDVKPLKHS